MHESHTFKQNMMLMFLYITGDEQLRRFRYTTPHHYEINVKSCIPIRKRAGIIPHDFTSYHDHVNREPLNPLFANSSLSLRPTLFCNPQSSRKISDHCNSLHEARLYEIRPYKANIASRLKYNLCLLYENQCPNIG